MAGGRTWSWMALAAGAVALGVGLVALGGLLRAGGPAPVQVASPERVATAEGLLGPIEGVQLQWVRADGLERVDLEGEVLAAMAACLAGLEQSSWEASETEPLLQETVLVLVRRVGRKPVNHELITPGHLKGGGGQYYASDCVYDRVAGVVGW